MPKLSVLMPVHNGVSAYPPWQMFKSVASILHLKCEKEVIVIDDGSTDNSVNHLLQHFGDTITIIQNDTNQGQGVALNKGLDAATGDYIWQWSVRGTAEESAVVLVGLLAANPHIGFVYGAMQSYGGEKPYMHRPPRVFSRSRFANRYLALFYMFRRVDHVRYTDYMKTSEGRHIGIADRDMLMQLMASGMIGMGLHDTLCVNYYNGGRHTMHDVADNRDEIDRLFWERWKDTI